MEKTEKTESQEFAIYCQTWRRKGHVYLNIFKKNLKDSTNLFGMGNDYYFQQDNDPTHTAYMVDG